MGKIMLYKAGRMCQSLSVITPASTNSRFYIDTNSYKATDGTTLTGIICTTYANATVAVSTVNNMSLFRSITGYVSPDTVSDFDASDYTTNEISNISYTRTESVSKNGRILNISATNNGASAVSVGSIKFTKSLVVRDTDGHDGNYTCLICGYFLDTPVTIEAGATKTFAVNIDCWNY